MAAPNPPFQKILVANRGEIAVRILRACRELGISGVAVFSEADRDALHTRMADEGVQIGPAPAGESYLDQEAIIQAALSAGAEAVHPGYGFLSENAAFAQAVLDAGLVFIGPPPIAIRKMGDKAAARQRMADAGVPLVPGYQGEDSDDSLAEQAGLIGYPVMVKAASGGGGKGMRIVSRQEDLPEALESTRREAAGAFGDSRLILERYIQNARHIEVQVLADNFGNTAHLNERECSIQRRHQKVIEESPSPFLDPSLRAEMGAAAISAAKAVGYANAGTVEFIVDPRSRSYYFLEMNTRLQVEHPVTEMTTGIDLVSAQIELAAGAELGALLQEPVPQTGHAIECRIYAEDPSNGFLPDSGPVLRFTHPQGPGVRMDAGITGGDTVTTHYDPLLAKLIVHAPDRTAAIRRMQTALMETALLGLQTNLEFLQAVIGHPDFLAGDLSTGFIERHFQGWQPEGAVPMEALIAAALASSPPAAQDLDAGGRPYSPWTHLEHFRLGAERKK